MTATDQHTTTSSPDSPDFSLVPGMARTRRVSRRYDAKGLLWLLVRRTLQVLISLAVLGWVSSRWIPISWIPPAAFAVLTLILLGRAIRIETTDRRDPTLIFSASLVVVAAAIAALYVWVWSTPVLLLAAASLAFVGAAGTGSRLRRLWHRRWLPPVILTGFALSLSIVGAVVAEQVDSTLPIWVYVLSVLAGYLALIFATEPWLALSDNAYRSPLVRALGATLVLASVFWLSTIGAGLLYAAVAVAIIAVLTLAITLDGDGEIFVLLILGALVWAVIPRSVDRPLIDELTRSDAPIVIAMGDSYMSGEGAERYFAGTNIRGENICRRAPTAWSQIFDDETTTISIACSGAVSSHVRGRPQYPGEPPDRLEGIDTSEGADQITQLGWLIDNAGPDRLDTVVLSIGGNDAGFTTAGIACVGPGDCSELAEIFLADFDQLEERLTALYGDIRTSMNDRGADDVDLLVAAYPIPLTEDGCRWTMLSADEHAFVVRFVRTLNDRIQAAANATDGVTYIGTIPDALDRHQLQLCQAGFWDGGLNFFEFNPMEGSLLAALDPRNWVNNSFHPNEDGHMALADASRRWRDGERPAPHPSAIEVDQPPCDGRAACDDYVKAWSRRQIAAQFGRMSVPVIAAFAGSWFLITPVLAAWRDRRFKIVGKLGIGRLVGRLIDAAESVL